MIKPKTGIAVDAWCQDNPGRGGYRGLDLRTGQVLFQWSCQYTTNNLVEFIAIVHAMKWRDKYRPNEKIWSDSMTALAWVKNKATKTKIDFTKAPDLKDRHDKCLKYLSKESRNHIHKWNTKSWGEIPADFGRK